MYCFDPTDAPAPKPHWAREGISHDIGGGEYRLAIFHLSDDTEKETSLRGRRL